MAPRRRRPIAEENNEDDSPTHQEPRSQSIRKRRRLTAYEVSHAIDRNEAVPASSADDGFDPGTIVRITLENFVTYDSAVFYPGPRLNLILGPNGTGKSSLVCAICLGLGYSPKYLGRASSIKEFVKHGKDVATIEIELKGLPSMPSNSIVRAQIRRDQSNQKWWLDGEETNHKTIQELARRYKIQVDNLCQFLPQDRVVEFATLNAVDLLRETLRATAPEQVLGWQTTLKELHRDQKSVDEAINADKEILRTLDDRQTGIQADVNRLREREEIQERVVDLQNARICAEYHQARKANMAAKAKRKETTEDLERLREESGPSLEAVTQKVAFKAELETVVQHQKRGFGSAGRLANQLLADVDTATTRVQSVVDELDAEEKMYDTKRRDITRSRQKISHLESQLKSEPPAFNSSEWNTKIRACEHQIRERESERREIDQQITQLKAQGRITKDELGRAGKAIEELESLAGQQVSLLKRTNGDVARGWEWLCQNQDQFSQEVFGPAMLCCSIKNERYSSLVQSTLGLDDFLCFTVQTREDHKKLSDQFYSKMGLAVSIRTCLATRSQFDAPVGPNDLQKLGLDGFAVDYIEGPDKVLAMLCSEKKLHQTGVALEDINAEQYGRLYQDGLVNAWAAGRQLYRVSRRREYGPDAVSTITRQVLPGRFWNDLPADVSEKAQLEHSLEEKQHEWDELTRQNSELRSRIESSDADIASKIKEVEEHKASKNERQRAYNQYNALPEKIETEKRMMERHRQELSRLRDKLHGMTMARDDALVVKAESILRHKAQIQEVILAHRSSVEAQIRLIEAESDIAGLNECVSHITEQLELRQETLAAVDAEVERTREHGRRAKVAVASMLQNNTEKRELYEQLATSRDLEEIDNEISAEEAKLELVHAVNPHVLREYEKRAREIARLRQTLEASTKKAESLRSEIKDFRGRFEPRVDELIRRISDNFGQNFERINCAGEVRVHKDEDFDQWGIEIRVRFRANESLQQLTQHRQSGGERAVSTVFYMMALTGLTRAPFRVVDEINQGMDPRNERMMHERLIDIACGDDSGQYFLITPKLLQNLPYHPNMRVLIIASGERMSPPPGGGGALDFASLIAIQKGLLAMVKARAEAAREGGESKGQGKGEGWGGARRLDLRN